MLEQQTVRVLRGVVSTADCRRLLRVLWDDFCERDVTPAPWSESNGALRYWTKYDAVPLQFPVKLWPGDVVVMPPRLPHAAGVNHGTEIRAGVYFRFLEPKEA